MKSMTSVNKDHLTDEQFSSLLLGDELDPAGSAHLLACEVCRREAGKFTSSVDLFSTTSLAWTNSEPARRSLLPVFRARERRALYLPLVWALAAMLLMTIGVPVWKQHRIAPPNPAAAQTASADSAAQVAEDNQLLQSVNLVLSSNEGSPLPEARLAEYARSASRTASLPASQTDSRIK